MAKGYSIYYPLKMRNRLNFLPQIALFLLLGRTVVAFSPVATVSSPEPFTLDGRSVLGSNLSVTSLDLERKSKPVAGRAVQPAVKPLTTPRSGEVTLP